MPGEIYERTAKSPPGYHSVAGEIVACDSSKIHVDGLTYEGAEEVFDYQTKEKVRGYKLFVIYDVVYRIPIYFEVRGINDADAPPLQDMVKKAVETTGKKIKRLYIDPGFYDEANFLWLDGKEHTEYVTGGKKGTKLYESKPTQGKASKKKRVRIAECTCSFSGGTPVWIVVEKKRTRLSNCEAF